MESGRRARAGALATTRAERTEQWFRAVDALHREGRVGKNGMPGPLAFGVLSSEYEDVFRLAVGAGAGCEAGVSLLGGPRPWLLGRKA